MYNNLGVVYKRIGKYNKALSYYEKALSISKNTKRLALYYNNIAYIHIMQGEHDKALQYIDKSLQIRIELLGENHTDLTDCYTYKGLVYLSKKEYAKALVNYKKATEILTQAFGEYHPLVANAYNNIAKVYMAQKKFSSALQYYQKAILANTINAQDMTNTSYADANYLLTSLQGKAKTYQQRYASQKNVTDLQKSIEIYQKADTLISSIRQTFTNYQDKVTFAETAKVLYKDAIAANMVLYEQNQDKKVLEQAFYYAEKSKSNTLKELLAAGNAKNYKGLPKNVITLEKELRTDHAFYRSQLTKQQTKQTRDTLKVTQYQNRLFEIGRKQDSITEVLEKNYPKYHALKYQHTVASISDIQNQLDGNTTVVEFFTADSSTYAFTISKHDMRVHQLATANLGAKIKKLHTSITTKNLKTYKSQANQLYNMLMAPIADQLIGDTLIIVPDGVLWHLNFELLLTQFDQSNNPVALSYFLRDKAISYANSANLVFNSFVKNTVKTTKQACLAFSFSDEQAPAETNSIRLATLRNTSADLPGTRKEIKAIADIIDGTYFYGSEAIEANFKKNASQYSMLHLALHGEVDHERPENSKLYFTNPTDSIQNITGETLVEDNFLYAHELFALDIPAELTVLSACNTGTGKIAQGEGIMSLGTAFQYAGTKSLLLTSWEVSDQTTPILMRNFYSNLKAGMNKSKALQQAKLEYLNTADLHRTHPLYWGGFYLVGDASPMQFDTGISWYWWAAGLLAVGTLVVVFLWYTRRKSNS
ncbi:CHAT domain-containing protein [Aquimarina pacifica]|uniref:CHAT domain-containing protein n=1 Tax=Aquimarina pacifica TaxID=1296415 RepID=UPI00047193EB|nr:CHAT domain-containing tetratricopeptide repeat protein [Aquimarina pacifica]